VSKALESADLVSGPVLPDPTVPLGVFDRTLWLTGQSPRFETANLAVRREVVERVGGFEAFASNSGDGDPPGIRPRPGEGHFGEDAVFGWRAVRAGARVAFSDDAIVHHAVFRRGPRGYISERWRLRYFPALVREVPEMRSQLPARVFLSRRSAQFDLALLGSLAALVTRRPWPIIATVPYARRHLRIHDLWRRSAARQNLTVVTADAVGLAALVRGSAAARCLLV
jgi:hypothetical protein